VGLHLANRDARSAVLSAVPTVLVEENLMDVRLSLVLHGEHLFDARIGADGALGVEPLHLNALRK
jgi:hypothetical protein